MSPAASLRGFLRIPRESAPPRSTGRLGRSSLGRGPLLAQRLPRPDSRSRVSVLSRRVCASSPGPGRSPDQRAARFTSARSLLGLSNTWTVGLGGCLRWPGWRPHRPLASLVCLRAASPLLRCSRRGVVCLLGLPGLAVGVAAVSAAWRGRRGVSARISSPSGRRRPSPPAPRRPLHR